MRQKAALASGGEQVIGIVLCLFGNRTERIMLLLKRVIRIITYLFFLKPVVSVL